ncbi:hypothetical protein LXL04_009828 [Taraxacum kok-saghyz]
MYYSFGYGSTKKQIKSRKNQLIGNDEELAADSDEAPMANFEANEHVEEQLYGNNTWKWGNLLPTREDFLLRGPQNSS